MTLEEVKALRPESGTSADFHAAHQRAEELRRELLAKAERLDEERKSGLLTLPDKAMQKIEQEAAAARLAADRITALLPGIAEEAERAEGLEALEQLREEARQAQAAADEAERWVEEHFEPIKRQVVRGLQLQARAERLRAEWRLKVEVAYRQLGVRDAGPIAVDVRPLSGPQLSNWFPWRI